MGKIRKPAPGSELLSDGTELWTPVSKVLTGMEACERHFWGWRLLGTP